MFFTRGITANRLLSTLTGLEKIPHVQNGTVCDHTGFGLSEAGTGTLTLTNETGFLGVHVNTASGVKHRCLVLSKIYDLTAIKRIYVNFACVATTAGGKYYTIGAVDNYHASLNVDPDISLLTEHGSAFVKQATARTSTHVIETQVIDVTDLNGYCKVFFEMYTYFSSGTDACELRVYNVVLEA